MSLIIPASQTLAAGGYDIDNSCRFNNDDTPAVTRTPSVTGNERTFTLSVWVKLGSGTQASSYYGQFFAARTGSSGHYGLMQIFDLSGLRFHFQDNTGASCRTLNKYRDCSAWYHVVYKIDSTESTDTDRVKIYVNGELATLDSPTYPSLNDDFNFNTGAVHHIGKLSTSGGSTDYFDGYMAEMHWIDGTALDADSFGEFDETYGHWKPIEVTGLTYGTNGFYLDFKDSSDLGNDVSGNGNDYTQTNLTASDQMTDTPTNNFCTLNILDDAPINKGTFSEGNLKFAGTSSGYYQGGEVGTLCTNQKIYYEILITATPAGDWNAGGIAPDDYNPSRFAVNNAVTDLPGENDSHGVTADWESSTIYYDGSSTLSYTTNIAVGDIMSFAFDPATGKFWIAQNGVWEGTGGTGNPVTGDYPLVTLTHLDHTWTGWQACYNHTAEIICNFGQDGTFAGEKTAQGNADGNGYGNFYYAPPSGFLALCTKNLPEPTVKPSEHFNTILYDDGAGAKTGVGFQPDLVWLKSRGSSYEHEWTDAVRGATKAVSSDATTGETTDSTGLTAFGSDGFTVGADTNYSDTTGDGMVAWNWKAGTSQGSTATSGSGTAKTYTAGYNVDAGFSIISYTGNGTGGHTIPHHLSVKPAIMLVKGTSATASWTVYADVAGMGAEKYLELHNTAAIQDSGAAIWNDTEPTSSVFTLGDSTDTNTNDATYVAYCWHSVEGYSKIGSYEGTYRFDATFIYLGFRPAYVLIKDLDSAGNWVMFDNKRNTHNPETKFLFPDVVTAEYDQNPMIDFLSNGMKMRVDDSYINNTRSYLYMAFAETPFKYANAR